MLPSPSPLRGRAPLPRRGFIEAAILIILVFLLGVGLLYYRSALQSTQTIVFRAELVKARNLARAGLEKALLFVHDRYGEGESGLRFAKGSRNERLAGELPAGSWHVESILPVTRLKVDARTELKRDYIDLPYRIGRSDRGRYDLLRIRSVGTTNVTSVALETDVKVVREEVRY